MMRTILYPGFMVDPQYRFLHKRLNLFRELATKFEEKTHLGKDVSVKLLQSLVESDSVKGLAPLDALFDLLKKAAFNLHEVERAGVKQHKTNSEVKMTQSQNSRSHKLLDDTVSKMNSLSADMMKEMNTHAQHVTKYREGCKLTLFGLADVDTDVYTPQGYDQDREPTNKQKHREEYAQQGYGQDRTPTNKPKLREEYAQQGYDQDRVPKIKPKSREGYAQQGNGQAKEPKNKPKLREKYAQQGYDQAREPKNKTNHMEGYAQQGNGQAKELKNKPKPREEYAHQGYDQAREPKNKPKPREECAQLGYGQAREPKNKPKPREECAQLGYGQAREPKNKTNHMEGYAQHGYDQERVPTIKTKPCSARDMVGTDYELIYHIQCEDVEKRKHEHIFPIQKKLLEMEEEMLTIACEFVLDVIQGGVTALIQASRLAGLSDELLEDLDRLDCEEIAFQLVDLMCLRYNYPNLKKYHIPSDRLPAQPYFVQPEVKEERKLKYFMAHYNINESNRNLVEADALCEFPLENMYVKAICKVKGKKNGQLGLKKGTTIKQKYVSTDGQMAFGWTRLCAGTSKTYGFYSINSTKTKPS